MNTNIKVSPSHELLEELKTAVFNCDIEADKVDMIVVYIQSLSVKQTV